MIIYHRHKYNGLMIFFFLWPKGRGGAVRNNVINVVVLLLQVTFSDEIETRSLGDTASDPNETVLQELRHRDSQVRELLEQKHFYEEVLSELCEEAGLFELDQNVVI